MKADMTERERFLDETYCPDNNVEVLRETINKLDKDLQRSAEDELLLTELKEFRAKYYANDKLAYYNICDIYYLFD